MVVIDSPSNVAEQVFKIMETACSKIPQRLGANFRDLVGMKGIGDYIRWICKVLRESVGPDHLVNFLDEIQFLGFLRKLDKEREDYRNPAFHNAGLVANEFKARSLIHLCFQFFVWCCDVPPERRDDINQSHVSCTRALKDLTF